MAAILFSMPAQNATGLLAGIIQIMKVDGLTIPKLYEPHIAFSKGPKIKI